METLKIYAVYSFKDLAAPDTQTSWEIVDLAIKEEYVLKKVVATTWCSNGGGYKDEIANFQLNIFDRGIDFKNPRSIGTILGAGSSETTWGPVLMLPSYSNALDIDFPDGVGINVGNRTTFDVIFNAKTGFIIGDRLEIVLNLFYL